MVEKLDLAALESSSRPPKPPKPEPVTDPRVVLRILSTPFHNASSKLHVGRMGQESELETITYHQSYADIERSPVTEECVATLLKNQWVNRSYGRYQYSISDQGYAQLEILRQEDIKKAHRIILTEGKLSSKIWCHIFRDYGTRCLNPGEDRYGVYLVNAIGEGFIVYVDTEELVRHDEPAFARDKSKPSSFKFMGMTYFQGRQVAHFRNPKTGSEVVFSPDDLKYHTFAPEIDQVQL